MNNENSRLEILTDYDWDYFQFKWDGKIYEINVSKKEFFELCKELNLSVFEFIQEILEKDKKMLELKYGVVVNFVS